MNRLNISKSRSGYNFCRSLVRKANNSLGSTFLNTGIDNGVNLIRISRFNSTIKDSGIGEKGKYVYFGDRMVDKDMKRKLIEQVFSSVSNKYDLMNDLMSLGLHRCWKDVFVEQIVSPESFLRIKRGQDEDFSNVTILDVAGGTGDVSFRIVEKFRKDNIEILPNIIVVDSSNEMIEQGQLKSIEKGGSNIIWIKDDGEQLSQIPSNSVDVVAISFGIRNFNNIEKGFESFYRVLKPGGRFLCLEFSKVSNPLISSIYQLYSSIVIPSLGEFVVGDRESYNYLVS
ncbi:ubiquinone menaquinone biosynthesis methyltransferases family [Cryptosporidium sp. chipmunk genotype I]|uniref:ubiquinone menaquinone biosynthesis methyltransferases family n=1 Tax=Cryptosporidium sp. chipmunk genotype I TaxID=1280935 RepID=UPI00351A399D|nr:ubiquinone menaquinone biosynthesis methyltransferases family [Cryptosporidium sp. chipmunk genotype I]